MEDILLKTEKLKQKLFELLKEKNLKISTAESCTGGMIGACLTSIPGISSYYGYGFVTYSNEAKQKLIGVKEETLKEFGAVSAQTVLEMAEGALNVSGSDIAVSVSGIAGPGGGTKEKPVGLVYIGLAFKNKTSFNRFIFKGNRDEVRQQTVNSALEMIINIIEKN
ncbi:MAG: CinA family protein [Clostridia bacterium]|nr:CinA family protein [Clostridia bacterium]MBO7289462.1 CinA family protein [Clostridia bacterium]